jgi:Ser/Thr protein kinase RdoA (MazF antagonist)
MDLKRFTDLAVVEEWGRVLGKMHTLARTLMIQPGKWLCNIFLYGIKLTVEHYLERIEEIGKQSDVAFRVHQHWLDVIARLEAIPKTPQTWGITHGDLNLSNFFVEHQADGSPKLWLFDFDQSQLTWFSADMTIPFFFSKYLDMHGWEPPLEGVNRQTFESTFIKGYESAFPLDHSLLELFSEYRTLYMTSVSLDIIYKDVKFEEGILSWVNKIVTHYDACDKMMP